MTLISQARLRSAYQSSKLERGWHVWGTVPKKFIQGCCRSCSIYRSLKNDLVIGFRSAPLSFQFKQIIAGSKGHKGSVMAPRFSTEEKLFLTRRRVIRRDSQAIVSRPIAFTMSRCLFLEPQLSLNRKEQERSF